MSVDRRKGLAQAKKLFLSGFTSEEVSYILAIPLDRLRRWVSQESWSSLQEACDTRVGELQAWILSCLCELRRGEAPSVSSREVLQYVEAYDKLARRQEGLSHYFDAFEALTRVLMRDVSDASSEEAREKSLSVLKLVRQRMDQVIEAKQSQLGA